MNRMPLSIILALVVCALLHPARAAFTSMQVFGDSISTITNNVSPITNYYGNRFCNGRVWVELLAQRQGLVLQTNQNLSFFGHHSSNLVVNASNYVSQADSNSTLFIVWVNNADFVLYINDSSYAPYASNNISIWTNAVNRSISNHVAIIQTLYAKGARTLVMPNAADVTKVPNYSFFAANSKAFIRQQIISFNTGLSNQLSLLANSLTNLAIVSPDFFSFVDDLLAHPTVYGFTNSTDDVIDEVANPPLNGPGTNYVFWDYLHPTAKVQEILADKAQALIAPVKLTSISQSGGSNQLGVVNLPIGLNGVVEGATNLTSWSTVQGFTSSNSTQNILVPVSVPAQFYRLRFPFAWSWP